MDAWIFAPMEALGGGNEMDLSMLGALRLVRMLRLVRLVRLLRMFRELWLIVNGFIQSLRTLGWIICLLSLVLYAFGILVTILVGHNCYEVDFFGQVTDVEVFERCDEYYGTVYRSMFSLFQVLTLDSWSDDFVRPLLEFYSPFFLVYFAVF